MMSSNQHRHQLRALGLAAALAATGLALPATAGTLRIAASSAAGAAPVNAAAGEHAFTIDNVGSGALSAVRIVSDPAHAVSCAGATQRGAAFPAAATLAAGDSVRCVTRPVTQARRRNASIAVVANDGSGHAVARSFSFMQPAAITPAQGIAVLAAGGIFNDANSNGVLEAGETISYHYSVLNLGTLALSGLAVTDIDGAVSCPQTTLAVNASMVCTQLHTITAAEQAATMVFNTVDLAGSASNGDPVGAGDFVVTQNLGGNAGIRVFKSPLLFDDVDASGYASAGDIVEYTFVVKNDNAQALATVDLAEDDPSHIDGAIVCDATTLGGQPFAGLGSGALQSNDIVLCSAQHTITAAEAGAGVATNLVEAGGQPGIGARVYGTGASAVLIPTAADVAVSKALTGESGSVPGVAEPGETLTYTITLSNSGAANAFNVGVVDPLDPNVIFVAASNGGTLSGNTVTWAGLTVPGNGTLALTVTVSVVDPIPLGTTQVLNLGYVAGTTPPDCAANPLPPACAITPTQPPPRLQVTKTASATSVDPGDTLTYTVTVTNVGSVVAHNVVISDPIPAGIASFAWTCAGSAGAACANASGSGAINETIASFPAGGQLVFTVVAQLTSTAAGNVFNTVSVTPDQITVCMPGATPGPCDATVIVAIRGVVGKVPATDAWALLVLLLALVMVAWRQHGRVPR